MSTALEHCPLCGGRAALAFTTFDHNRELSPDPFRYRRCAACGVLSLVDIPADLGRFYPPSYYDLPGAADLERLAAGEAAKLALVRRQVREGRLVEIGPGAGVFSYAAKRAGFAVTDIEMDARCCEHLRDVVGVEAIHDDDPAGALRRLPPSDAITLWHVLEHLPDPWEVVDAAAANLRPGGVLAIATPNPQSLQFRLLGGRWAHVDAPRHLFLLPLDALTARAGAGGLDRAAVTTSDPAGRHWNRFGWEAAVRRPTLALAITLAVRPIERRGRRGAAYTAIFRKDGA